MFAGRVNCVVARKKDLSAKREAARREIARASRKVRLIRQGKYFTASNSPFHYLRDRYGVDISGTKYDPRPKMDVSRMTERQLDRAIERMREFTNSRNVVYFRGARPTDIISGRSVLRAQSVTKRWNEMVRERNERVAHVRMPWHGESMTADLWMHDFMPRGDYLPDYSGYSLRERKVPTPGRWRDDKAAARWVKMVEGNLGPGAERQRVAAIRGQIGDMMKYIGDDGLKARIDGMSDEVLYFMWTSDRSFADALSTLYENVKYEQETGDKSQVHAQLEEYSYTMLNNIFDAHDQVLSDLTKGR